MPLIDIIGINRRNLKSPNLEIDKDRVQKLAPKIRKDFPDVIIIAESGYDSYEDVARDAPLVDGFLIGTAITNGTLSLAELKRRFPDKQFIFQPTITPPSQKLKEVEMRKPPYFLRKVLENGVLSSKFFKDFKGYYLLIIPLKIKTAKEAMNFFGVCRRSTEYCQFGFLGKSCAVYTNGFSEHLRPMIPMIKEKVLNDCIKNPGKYLK